MLPAFNRLKEADDGSMDESFGKRLQMLEDLVATLVDEQRRLTAQIAGNRDTGNARPECSLGLGHMDSTVVSQETIDNVPPVLVDEASGGLIDPELVQPTAQQLEVPEITAANTTPGAVQSSNDGKEEPTSAYTDNYGQIYTHGDDAQ